MEERFLEFAKKYIVYPEVSNSEPKKKCSKIFFGENVYICDIDDFLKQQPKYAKKVDEWRKKSKEDAAEFVFFIGANSNFDKSFVLPSYWHNETMYLIVEEHAHVTIIDSIRDYKSSMRSIFIFLESNATMRYRYYASNFSTIEVFQQKDSFFSFFATIINVLFTHLSLDIKLQEQGASAEVAGYYWLKNKEQCALSVIQHHQAAHTKSNLKIHGVLFDSSQVVYQGLIIVDEGAQQSNGAQSNKSIVMSSNCRAISVPNLEVNAHDVICKHGSAVGKLDSDQLFYLESRGIDALNAKRMLLKSFIYEPFVQNQSELEWVKETIKSLDI